MTQRTAILSLVHVPGVCYKLLDTVFLGSDEGMCEATDALQAAAAAVT
jgi:hypothetical protein